LSPISTRWSRARLGFGVFTACGALALGVSGPAYAAPAAGHATTTVTTSVLSDSASTGGASRQTPDSAAPSLNAPVSGRTVSGAVSGTAARTKAGSAAGDFLKEHRSILDASRSANSESPSTATPAASQLHDWWGSFPDADSGPGTMATQSVSSTLRLSNSNDVLYAPTMTPADNSCIEVVTVHTTGTPQIWAWDWCNSIAPGAEVDVDSSFIADYTTTVNGRTAYTTKDVQTDASTNTWTAYLWNYATSSWDTLFTSSGTDQSGLSYGWDMFEFYSTVKSGKVAICGDLASSGVSIESSSLQILGSNGTWSLADSADSSWSPSADPNPASYDCPDMKFDTVDNNYDWIVNVS
jgi:hypothetical protein